jgi:hypothetical protein
LPLVGSITVPPGKSFPSRSPADSMAAPIRHLTLFRGLKDSTLPRITPGKPSPIFFSLFGPYILNSFTHISENINNNGL